MFKIRFPWAIFFIIALSRLAAFAEEPQVTSEQLQFLNDISIAVADVDAPQDIIIAKTIRIYATVHNASGRDIKGVVRFYNERLKKFMGPDQPFSAVAYGTDVVFLDVNPEVLGENPVAVRVIPDNPVGDDPSNNKVTDILVVDRDSDHDGIGDRRDPDDDNDRVPDKNDAFPLDPKESQDTDKDNIGNNEDLDDDNDQVPDIQDAMPTNHGPVLVVTASGGGGGGGGGSSYQFRGEPSADNAPASNDASSNTAPGTSNVSPSSSGGSGPSGSSSSPVRTSPSPSSSAPAKKSENQEPAPPTSSQASPLSSRAPCPVLDRTGPCPAVDTAGRAEESEPPAPTPKVDEVITFDASKSYDPDGKIVTVKWDFGDGAKEEGLTVAHRYEEAGDYLITLTLADDKGETRQETFNIQIGQKVIPWIIGSVAILLIGVMSFIRWQSPFQKGLSKKNKRFKINPAS